MATRARILADYVSGGATAAEFDYLDGVTSNIQTQFTAKAPLASPAFTGTPTGITAAHITSGVLPVGVTGGSGLTALGTVTAGNLANTAIVYPVGHVIQTIYGSAHEGSSTHSSGGGEGPSWEQKTSPNVTITKRYSSSAILITGSIMTDNQSDLMYIDIYRSGTGVTDERIGGESAGLGYTYGNGSRTISFVPVVVIDAPSVADIAITYKYSYRASGDVGVVIGAPDVLTRLIAMEIKGA